MPLHLIKYIENQGGNKEKTHDMIQQFLSGYPPSYLGTSKTKYFHRAYSKKTKEKCMAKLMLYIARREMVHNTAFHELMEPLRDDKSKKDIFALSALIYHVYGIGNCSHRASYAGIKLSTALKGSNNKVIIFSYPAKDQFVCILINRDKKYWIYDPLTNPELVFEKDEYEEAILTAIPKIPKQQQAIRVYYPVDETMKPLFDKALHAYYQSVRYGDLSELIVEIAGQPWMLEKDIFNYICNHYPEGGITDLVKDALTQLQRHRRSEHSKIKDLALSTVTFFKEKESLCGHFTLSNKEQDDWSSNYQKHAGEPVNDKQGPGYGF